MRKRENEKRRRSQVMDGKGRKGENERVQERERGEMRRWEEYQDRRWWKRGEKEDERRVGEEWRK